MNAATVVCDAVQGTPDLRDTLRKELSQLRILLLGARADIEDATGPVLCRRSAVEVKQGLKKAVVCLDAIRARVEDGCPLEPTA